MVVELSLSSKIKQLLPCICKIKGTSKLFLKIYKKKNTQSFLRPQDFCSKKGLGWLENKPNFKIFLKKGPKILHSSVNFLRERIKSAKGFKIYFSNPLKNYELTWATIFDYIFPLKAKNLLKDFFKAKNFF